MVIVNSNDGKASIEEHGDDTIGACEKLHAYKNEQYQNTSNK